MEDKEFQNYVGQQISEINRNLNNHVNHLTAEISEIKTDVKWLRELREKQNDSQESKDDIKTQQDADWLKTGFWWLVGVTLGGYGVIITAIIYHIYNSK